MAQKGLRTLAKINAEWNEDLEGDIELEDYKELKVLSRDWTVQTIVSQVEQDNIDLDPEFQRRNVWRDERRSRLVESLILSVPVPEIVLAESRDEGKKYIVIDGKQRLLTVAGFLNPDKTPSWETPRLIGLKILEELNGKSFADFQKELPLKKFQSALENADMRCTIVSSPHGDDALYDIFNRLNTSSVPLSSQELRQALFKGDFSKFLLNATDGQTPNLHEVLGTDGADHRMRDAEILLRFIAIKMFPEKYRGNVKKFLDTAMKNINSQWNTCKPEVYALVTRMEAGIKTLIELFGTEHVGRKFKGGEWEGQFNKVLFEVELYFLAEISKQKLSQAGKAKFLKKFKELFDDDEFVSSVESTTKSVANYKIRFDRFSSLVSISFGKGLVETPFGKDDLK